MNLSTSLNIFNTEKPVEKSIQRCVMAGFTALDLNYCDHQKELLLKPWVEEESWAKHVRYTADKYGIPFTQMHGPIQGVAFNGMMMGLNVESFLELAQRALRTAAIVGIPWVVFHPGMISSAGVEPYQEVLNYNCSFWRRLIPVMEASGVGVALENLHDPAESSPFRRQYCSVPGELIELIDKIDHPLIGACWDTGHGHIQSLNQRSSIQMLGQRLKALHIHDNNGDKDQHFLPYHGTIDWKEVMAALRSIEFQGDFTYEVQPAIRVLPDGLRDAALKYAAELGSCLIKGFE